MSTSTFRVWFEHDTGPYAMLEQHPSEAKAIEAHSDDPFFMGVTAPDEVIPVVKDDPSLRRERETDKGTWFYGKVQA